MPVDVYYDWVDACEAAQKEHKEAGGDPDDIVAPRDMSGMGSRPGAPKLNRPGAGAVASGSGYTDRGAEGDDFVVEDEEDNEGEFGSGLDDDDD